MLSKDVKNASELNRNFLKQLSQDCKPPCTCQPAFSQSHTLTFKRNEKLYRKIILKWVGLVCWGGTSVALFGVVLNTSGRLWRSHVRLITPLALSRSEGACSALHLVLLDSPAIGLLRRPHFVLLRSCPHVLRNVCAQVLFCAVRPVRAVCAICFQAWPQVWRMVRAPDRCSWT